MTNFLNVIGWLVLIVGVGLWVAILATGLSNLRKPQRPTGARAPAAQPTLPQPTEQTASEESPLGTKAE